MEQANRVVMKKIGAAFTAVAFLASFAVLSSSIASAAWEKETAWQRAESAADRKDHKKAATLYHFAAIRGHADAQYKLAERLWSGRGVISNGSEALYWYRQAAEQGHGAAQEKLGEIYEGGYSTPQDYVTAYFWFSLAAEAEGGRRADRATQKLAPRVTPAQLAEAQARRAAWRVAFEARDNSVSQDVVLPGWDRDAEEAERLRTAAEQGDAAAQYALGTRYQSGKGVPLDTLEAAKWFQRSADQDHVPALLALATLYEESLIGGPGEDEEVEIYRHAAALGSSHAQYRLGQIYDRRWGPDADKAEAAKWYRLASEQGHPDAQVAMGGLYGSGQGVQQDYAKAERLYRLAADQGHALGQFALGEMYLAGVVVEQDEVEALRLNRLAAQQGEPYALWRLGTLYKNGVAVPQDEIQAHMWFNLTMAIRGLGEGRRDELAENMSAEQVAEAQARAVAWFEDFQARQGGTEQSGAPPQVEDEL